MRRLSIITVFALLVPLASVAQAEEADGRVYYKNGMRLDAGGTEVKANIQLQPRYEFNRLDDAFGPNDELGGNRQNTSGFDMRRARLILSGHVLDKAFSFKLQNDFASDAGGSDLKDAWIQWNGDFTKIRFGQTKVPFVRQFMVSSANLFFPDRGIVSEFFDSGRNQGAMAHNNIGDNGHYYLAIFNGDSTGEGANAGPTDTKHTGVFALNFSTPDYGSRGSEGALDGEEGFTVGGSAIYGQGSRDVAGGPGLDFDQVELNADAGFRGAGLDAQAEVVYSSFQPDGFSDLDQIGYYVQGNYTCPDAPWGVGGRFGYIDPDSDDVISDPIDDLMEYTVGLNYYIDGHRLKVQNQVTWEVLSPQGSGSDREDVRYVLQLSGYF